MPHLGQIEPVAASAAPGGSSDYNVSLGWEAGSVGQAISPSLCAVQWSAPVTVAGSIVAAHFMSDVNTTATVEVYLLAFASGPPTVANKISASAPITLTAAKASTDTTLTGWSTSVAVGDVIGFKLLTNSLGQRLLPGVKIQP